MYLRNYLVGYDDPTPDPKPEDKPTYTKEELTAAIEAERKQVRAVKEELTKALEQSKQKANLSEEEKKAIEVRIETLQSELQTKEEIGKKEIARLQKEKADAEESLKKEVKKWQIQHDTVLRDNEILKEATKAEAYRPEQVITLLKDKTAVVEEIDNEGKPLGKYKVQVTFPVLKDGKPQDLKLSVAEALKMMKDDKEQYGNLFKANIQGGVGLSTDGKQPTIDIKNMTPEQYRKHREQIKKGSK